MKRKINMPLVLGGLILLMLLSVILVPSFYTKYNPYATETLKSYQDDSGNFKFMTPPFAPDERHKLGTDEMGRDLVSLIVYGARLTIGISLMVVFFRFLLSLFIGIPAAFGNPVAQGTIRLSNIVFNFVPPLIICVIILKIQFFESLPKELSFWVFVFMLTLVGWSRVAEVVQSRSEDILGQDFIRSEISIGKSRRMIALTNVVPHLAAEMTVMAFMEIAVVLGLLMQLGAFMVFIGNLRIVEKSDRGIIISKPMSFEPEWAAMMGASKTYLRSAPWLVFSPAVAFFISILGFNMFGEGLRKALQVQNSKFMTRVKGYKKPALLGVLIIGIAFALSQNAGEKGSLAPPSELPDFAVVRQDNKDMADWLESRMIDQGLKPIDSSYKTAYDFTPYWLTESAELELDGGQVLVRQKDFVVAGYGNGQFNGVLYDGRTVDVLGHEDLQLSGGELLLLDGTYYTQSAVEDYIDHIGASNHIGAVIVIMSDLTTIDNLGSFRAQMPVLFVRQGLDWDIGSQAKIRVQCAEIEGQGMNLYGVIEGKTDKVNDEAIIIGGQYNYESPQERESLIAMLELMEAFSKDRHKLDRKVIFAFWDGSHTSTGYGLLEYLKHPLYAPKDTAVYLDVSVVADQGQILFDDSHAPHSRFYGWSLAQRAGKIGQDVDVQRTKDLVKSRPDIFTRGPSCIHVQLGDMDGIETRTGTGTGTNRPAYVTEDLTGFIYDLILGGAY